VRPLVWAATLVWSAVFAAQALAGEPRDGDLWWQAALGETVLQQHAIPGVLGPSTYTAPQAAWVAHEWLFSVAYAWCVAHHAERGFQLALAACAAATIVFVAARAAALGGGRFAGPCAVVCGAALTESFGVRAQVAAWPFLALFLLLFEQRGAARWWALPVVVAWANLHASVVLAPALAAIGVLDGRRPLRERLAMFGATAGATLCTPFGIALPEMALAWSFDPDAAFITEWARPSLGDWPFLAGGVLPAAVVLADLRARALSWAQRAMALLAVLAMIDHARNLATGAIVIVPLAGVVLAALAGPGRAWRWTRSDAGLVALAGVGAAIVAIAAVRGDQARLPARGAVAATQAFAGPQRVYCEDFSWCSLFASDPAVRVFLDGRTDAYPHAVFAAWNGVRSAAPDWDALLETYRTTTIVAWSHGALATAAARSPRWRVRFADPRVTVFVRSRERR